MHVHFKVEQKVKYKSDLGIMDDACNGIFQDAQ